jgi:hypothetical protein
MTRPSEELEKAIHENTCEGLGKMFPQELVEKVADALIEVIYNERFARRRNRYTKLRK